MSRKIYEKYCDGGTINNKELEQAICDYEVAHDALLKLGPMFEVSRKAIGQTLIWLCSIREARRKP